MMYYLFLAAFEESDEHFNRGLEVLRSGTVDIHAFDNQLLRELYIPRWSPERQHILFSEVSKQLLREIELKTLSTT